MTDSAVPASPIRVFLVEDHDMVAEALQLALDRPGGLTVVGRVRTRADAVEGTRRLRPDVVLLDLRLADGDGTDVLAELAGHGARVLVITGDATPAVARRVARAGAAGLLPKSSRLDVLEAAVREVAAGGEVFEAGTVERPDGPGSKLTARERQTLELLAEGASTEQIGDRLGVSRNTTRNHVQRVLEKLGARSKLEAVAVARREGLLG